MPKGKKGFQKGHSRLNTGRTLFKKGQVPWNKNTNIMTNDNFIKNNPMKNPEIAKKMSKSRISLRLKVTEEQKKKMADGRIKAIENGAVLKTPIKKGQTYEEVFGEEKARLIKEKQSIASLGKPKSEEHKKNVRIARRDQITPVKDTKIEVKIKNLLTELEIEFLTHNFMHIEHGYQCDIFIPSKNIVIECDGDYWHGNPLRNKELDERQKAQRLKDDIRTKKLEAKGFNVIRLWESDIKIMDINKFMEIITK